MDVLIKLVAQPVLELADWRRFPDSVFGFVITGTQPLCKGARPKNYLKSLYVLRLEG